jgi:hypothetical protein
MCSNSSGCGAIQNAPMLQNHYSRCQPLTGCFRANGTWFHNLALSANPPGPVQPLTPARCGISKWAKHNKDMYGKGTSVHHGLPAVQNKTSKSRIVGV